MGYIKNRESIKSKEKEVDFQWFVFGFLSHWKWFLVSIIAFLFIGYFYLRYSLPVYDVAAKLIVKDNRRGGSSNTELKKK